MRCIVFFSIIAGLLLCVACAENNENKKKLEGKINSFKQTAINLPDNMLAQNCDENTPADTGLLRRPLKMIVYLNNEGCQNCKMQSLSHIYMFMLENEAFKNFAVIIILNPVDVEEAKKTLADMNFKRTVFFDLDGSFERLNPHLPAEELFHTFLMNEKNEVILVGNPVHNEKLKKLYLSEMSK